MVLPFVSWLKTLLSRISEPSGRTYRLGWVPQIIIMQVSCCVAATSQSISIWGSDMDRTLSSRSDFIAVLRIPNPHWWRGLAAGWLLSKVLQL